MTRLTVVKKEEKKPMNPMWRGIGCITIVAIFVLSFLLSLWFINATIANPGNMPNSLAFLPGALNQMRGQFISQAPWFDGIGQYVPPLLFSLVVSLIMFGLVSFIYTLIRGTHTDPRDVRNWEPEGRKRRKVRKCR